MSDKTPLAKSNGALGEPVDYEAIFDKGEGFRRKEFAQKTLIGECRNPKRISWVEWVFMVVATFSLLGVLAATIERLVYFKHQFDSIELIDNTTGNVTCDTWVCTNDFIFTIVILVNIGFCMFYCYDGLLRERPFEILAYVVAVTVIIVYIIVNYIVKGEEDQPFRLARLVLVCVLGPVNIVLALLSWWKMGYLVLNIIGTNTKLIRAYRFRSFFLTVQLFHLELLSSLFVVAWFQRGHFLEMWEKVIICLLLIFMLCVTAVGGITILWEISWLAYVWYVLILPCGVYYLYKLINVSVNFEDYQVEFLENNTTSTVSSVYAGGALLSTTLLGLVVVVVLIIFMTLSLVNFKKGLKEKIPPPLHRYLSRLQTVNS